MGIKAQERPQTMVDCSDTLQQCERALAKWQYDNGGHSEGCVELKAVVGACRTAADNVTASLTKQSEPVGEIARTYKSQPDHHSETDA